MIDNYTFRSAIWTYQFLLVFQIADLSVLAKFDAFRSAIWALRQQTHQSEWSVLNECSDQMYPNQFFFFPSLCQIVCSSCLCLVLYFLSTSLVVFLDFFVQLWNSASLLLVAIHCPFLTHAQTMSVFAVLFCQPMSFPGVEYSVLSHS